MRGLVFAVMAFPVMATASPVLAEDVLDWTSPSGMQVGDYGRELTSSEGLTVGWRAERSYADGRMRVVAEFCNSGSSEWEGGMRLTHIPPDRGHLTLRVPASDCVTREEIIPTGVPAIYVYLNEY